MYGGGACDYWVKETISLKLRVFSSRMAQRCMFTDYLFIYSFIYLPLMDDSLHLTC